MNTKLSIGICALFLILLTAAISYAATITVTNKNDSGGGCFACFNFVGSRFGAVGRNAVVKENL
jgi:hypothetical protein